MKANAHPVIAFVCLACASVSPQTGQHAGKALPPALYFPPGVFDNNGRSGTATVKWYGCALQALEEPPLTANSDHSAVTYRFLWLRTFHHPVSVRIVLNPNGDSIVTTKISDGAGGYRPGKLIVNTSRTVDQTEVKLLSDQLQAISFWSLPTEDDQAVGEETAAGYQVRLAPVDGARWVLEGAKGGEYHVVDRWSPLNNTVGAKFSREYAELCRYMLKLGHVDVPKKEVY